MSRSILLIMLVAVVSAYVVNSSIQRVLVAVESKKNEAWIKHSDLPEACLACHAGYYNRIDTKIKKFKGWHDLNDFVSCTGKYDGRVKEGTRVMPCVNVEPLSVKMAYKMMVK